MKSHRLKIKNSTKRNILFILLWAPVFCFGQWNGTGTSGPIYRDGNVGIGIVPTSPLHIFSSNPQISPVFISANDAEMEFTRHSLNLTSKSNFNNVPYIAWYTNTGARQAYLGWRSDVFGLTLENSFNFSIVGGNVGIGTTAPHNKLEIYSPNRQLRLTDSDDEKYWQVSASSQSLAFRYQEDQPEEKLALFMNSLGHVGIGTSPLNLLDVNGVARFRRMESPTAGFTLGGDALTLSGWGAHNPFIEWINSNSIRQGYMGWNTDRLSLVMENGYNFTIENGNVGIGTTSPDAKLTVKGHIHTQEVRVDLTGAVAPDYVFEKDYNLLSLKELETYINQNKHLPEVPSAKDMETDGLNLKEMNLILLKHLIDQNKKLEIYFQENINLKKEVDQLKK